jgi:membrane-bound lytic murein transglycosylase F
METNQAQTEKTLMGFESAGASFQPASQAGYSSACRAPAATVHIALGLFFAVMLGACGKPPSLLEQIQSRNELIVITRNSPTTYYVGSDGPTGFEYELASRFAAHLGVELRIVVPANFKDILPQVARGNAHLAAAGLTVTDRRKQTVRFGPVYQEITPQLIYRRGSGRPKSFDNLEGHLEVVAGSSHVERLEAALEEYPDLSWQENEELESEDLLSMVWQQLIDYTIADSNELSINRHFYPELHPAFDISPPRPLAWAMARSDDDSLYNATVDFFAGIREDGSLDQLIERYYGHISDFDYVGTRRYQAHIEQRLPPYLDVFKQAAGLVDMDWRLIAAIGYQESHWDEDAVSPTGVRGLMMLTQAAAKDLGIEDRLDPVQSILGGARYIERMRAKIPERIAEPDRTWLALAAYNVGYGHLEDARILTQKNGGDADKWIDVKKNLPLLSQKKWFKQTRYGYARGREPVRYVENIRSYYDILIWYTDREIVEAEVPKPLMLDSPAL